MRWILLCFLFLLSSCEQRQHPVFEESLGIGPINFHWEHFPIHVQVPDGITPAYDQEIVNGILAWNRALDREVFVIDRVKEPSFTQPPGVVVIAFSVLPLNMNAITYDDADLSGAVSNAIVIYNIAGTPLSPSDIWYTTVHEFGHVLGLAHDDSQEESIMYPYLTHRQTIIEELDLDYIELQLNQPR